MKKTKKRRGPPSKKTKKTIDMILSGIAGGKSSRAMCVEVGITQQTMWRWLDEDKALSEQYARAKEKCADYYAEEIVEISDDGTRDYTVDSDGIAIVDHDHIARARLRVDARKWYASKLVPKKYGDKVTQELTGGDGGDIKLSLKVVFGAG